MTGSIGEQAQPAPQEGRHGWAKHISAGLAFGYLVVAIAGLIILRATIGRLDFIGIGWLIGLAVIPLLPWALPRLGGFLEKMSRYVSRVGVGSVHIVLRDVFSEPIVVSTTGGSVVPESLSPMSGSTAINVVIADLRSRRIRGRAPCGVIDLQEGRKWRLPNLYYLSVVLEVDPVVGMLFFTEKRGGIDDYFVRMSSPKEFGRQVDEAVPAYGLARRSLQLPESGDLSASGTAELLVKAFTDFQEALPQDSGEDDDPVFGYVSGRRLEQLLASPRDPVVESPGETLSGEQLRSVVNAAYRYVPTTTFGRLTGLIERDMVTLKVARAALTRTAAA